VCGVTSDGGVVCWGDNSGGKVDVPEVLQGREGGDDDGGNDDGGGGDDDGGGGDDGGAEGRGGDGGRQHRL
jgi:hypothetical protein